MKIYLSHSTNFNFKEDLYQLIKKEDFHNNFIFPHEKSDKQYPVKKLFSSKKCNLIIAEISFPSTGQGIELGWANIRKIPIVCFYKNGANYSKSLNQISKKIIKYNDANDLIKKIKQLI
jgi:nucleoside 2-deoxyribosyltransferase